MRSLIIFSLFLTFSCSGGKNTYMCGDHKCIDKKEYNEYFAKNLSIEVDLKNKKNKDRSIDLVKLNTEKNLIENKKFDLKISKDKERTRKIEEKKIKQKILKQREIEKRKKNRKKLSINEKIIKVKEKTSDIKKKTQSNEIKETPSNSKMLIKKEKLIEKNYCTDIFDCDIDKISEVLIKKGANKDFPDITLR